MYSQSRSRPGGQQPGRENEMFPSRLTRLQDVLDSEKVGFPVNVAGVVTDVRQPMPTSGKDYKMTLRLVDRSTEDTGLSIDVVIFRPENEMPKIEYSDVVLANQFKLQDRNGDKSLLSTFRCDIFVFSAKSIPRPPHTAEIALKPHTTTPKYQISKEELKYIPYLIHGLDKTCLPDAETFQIRASQSLNVKPKFRLLKDCNVPSTGNAVFADLVVKVVREPYDLGDKMTLWVSDYTTNDAFFHHTLSGDPYGYTNGTEIASSSATAWQGPLGKRSMQVTVWDHHAEYIRNEVKAGNWIRLRNVHLAYGHNSANLEGKLRSSQNGTHVGSLGVEVLSKNNDYHASSPEWKEAMRRMMAYDKQKRNELKELQNGKEGKSSKKRKSDDAGLPKPMNSKARRAAERAAKLQEVDQRGEKAQQQLQEQLDLNQNIRCENPEKPYSPFSELIEPYLHPTIIDGTEVLVPLPFVNLTYRCAVRVVDFFPSKITSFATSRIIKDTDILSHHSDAGSSSSEEDDDREPASSALTGPATQAPPSDDLIWEWRFALLLEDASQPNKKLIATDPERIWVSVDNTAAQMLNLPNATDLTRDVEALSTLHNRMFNLWGDLAEKKQAERERLERAIAARPKGSKRGRPGKPDVDSSDNEAEEVAMPASQAVRNRPFACCIRQFGARVKAKEGEHAGAGDGKKWERAFALFGTKICDV